MAPPDIRRAWNFYYGRTLPRREAEHEDAAGNPTSWRKLEPVESGGELYPLSTPLRELGDFGLGVGLYFSSRVAMVIMFSLIGFLNALTIMAYYRSDVYDPEGSKIDLPYDLRASAICTTEHKICLDWECLEKTKRVYCPMFRFEDGFVDIVSIAILLAYLVLVTISQQHIVTNADLRDQTAADYSIVVLDPNPDATDPEEWRTYFSTFGHVSYVSIGSDNGNLLNLLAAKRSVLMELHRELEEDEDEDYKPTFTEVKEKMKQSLFANFSMYKPLPQEEEKAEKVEDGKAPGKLKKIMSMAPRKLETRASWNEEDEQNMNSMVENMGSGGETWRRKVEVLAAQEAKDRDFNSHMWLGIQDCFAFMRDTKYFRAQLYNIERQIQMEKQNRGHAKASKVFITFEETKSQHKCLEALKLGQIATRVNTGLPREDRFRFNNCLTIDQAPEPREIHWTELNTTTIQWAMSLVAGIVACIVFGVVAAVIYKALSDCPACVGIAVSLMNMAVAPVMRYLTKKEKHMTRSGEHVWLLLKLVSTRWFISVIVYKALTPFTETISVKAIQTIRAILICDMLIKPCFQVQCALL